MTILFVITWGGAVTGLWRAEHPIGHRTIPLTKRDPAVMSITLRVRNPALEKAKSEVQSWRPWSQILRFESHLHLLALV